MSAREISMRIGTDGTLTGMYSDDFDWATIGEPAICRASYVEPCEGTCWWKVDLTLSGGRVYWRDEHGKKFKTRAAALEFERRWLDKQLFGHG